MLQNGVITWGQPVSWDAIIEDLYDDVASELEELKNADDEEEGGADVE